MKTNLFEGMSLTEKEMRENLEAECAETEKDYNYKKSYSEPELAEIREEFTDLAVKQARIENKIADLIKPYKAELKDIKKQVKHKMEEIQMGGYWAVENVYLFPDYENRVMARYNQDGEYVDSRPMTRTERQYHLELTQKLKKAE